MALVVDSVPMFLDHVWRQLKPVRDALLAVGFFYSVKKLACFFKDVCIGVKVFGVSRILSPTDWHTRYGKWAVVTGCTSGIGERFAHELASRGLNVILVSRSLEKLSLLSKKMEAEHGVETVTAAVDFSSGRAAIADSQLENIFRDREVGVLVNNVGIGNGHVGYPQFFDEQTIDDNWDLVNVNVGCHLAVTRMVLPQMQARRRGAVINLGSRAAVRPVPLMSTYSASKAFMRYWTKALDVELRPFNIDVLLLEPSYVVTALTGITLTPTLRMPSAETYVSYAIRTLGWTSHTTGYWPHSLEAYMLGCFLRIPDRLIKLALLKLRNSGSNNVAKRAF